MKSCASGFVIDSDVILQVRGCCAFYEVKGIAANAHEHKEKE